MTYKRKETIGDCELYLGDCLVVMPTLGPVDAVVTDPPYGIGFGRKHTKWSANREVHLGEWDSNIPDVSFLAEHCGPVIVWGGERFGFPVSRGWLTWVKPDAAPTFSSTEYAWTNMDRPAKHFVQSISSVNAERIGHPTQKPLRLMRWCLLQLPDDTETILDPFMGSGTTGVACVKLGRKFIGIELEEKYFDIACKRIEDAYKQPDLFIAPPAEKPVQEDLI